MTYHSFVCKIWVAMIFAAFPAAWALFPNSIPEFRVSPDLITNYMVSSLLILDVVLRQGQIMLGVWNDLKEIDSCVARQRLSVPCWQDAVVPFSTMLCLIAALSVIMMTYSDCLISMLLLYIIADYLITIFDKMGTEHRARKCKDFLNDLAVRRRLTREQEINFAFWIERDHNKRIVRLAVGQCIALALVWSGIYFGLGELAIVLPAYIVLRCSHSLNEKTVWGWRKDRLVLLKKYC